MKINSILEEAQKLDYSIRNLFRISTFNEYDDLSGLDIDYNDAQQLFLLDELRGILEKLDDVHDRIYYLSLSIKETSVLHRNESGRFETVHGYYYCSGSRIEAFIEDDYREVSYWVRTSVEHDGKDYYLVGYRDVPLEGLTVRVR